MEETHKGLQSQTGVAASDAAFEVASVKVNRSGQPFVQVGMAPGGRFTATNVRSAS